MPGLWKCRAALMPTHMDGGARPLGLELSFIRLPEQEAQPPPVSLPYRFHVRHFLTDLLHQRRAGAVEMQGGFDAGA